MKLRAISADGNRSSREIEVIVSKSQGSKSLPGNILNIVRMLLAIVFYCSLES